MDFMINYSVFFPEPELLIEDELKESGIESWIIKLLQKSRLKHNNYIITKNEIKRLCPDITENQLTLLDFSVPFFEQDDQNSFRSKNENEILKNTTFKGTEGKDCFFNFCKQFLKITSSNSINEKRCLILFNTVLSGKALTYFHKMRTTEGFLSTMEAIQALAFKFGNQTKVDQLCSKYKWSDVEEIHENVTENILSPHQPDIETFSIPKSNEHIPDENHNESTQKDEIIEPESETLSIPKSNEHISDENHESTQKDEIIEPESEIQCKSCLTLNEKEMKQTNVHQIDTNNISSLNLFDDNNPRKYLASHQIVSDTNGNQIKPTNQIQTDGFLSKSKMTLALKNGPYFVKQMSSLEMPLESKNLEPTPFYAKDFIYKKSRFPNDIHLCTNQAYFWDRGKIHL